MPGAAVGGQRGLERLDLGTQDELAVRNHPRDGFVDRRLQSPSLCDEVDERDRGESARVRWFIDASIQSR